MQKTIIPSRIVPSEIVIPSSKSLSHRALISAALAQGQSVIHSLAANNDTAATMNVMRKAGASFTWKDTDLLVQGISQFSYDGSVLDCAESGSTLRFLIPVFAIGTQTAVFTGHGKLMERPQSVYEEIFAAQHLPFAAANHTLTIRGPLKSGRYPVRGNVSSQFISGLLFALPLLSNSSTIEVLPPFESASYVGLTIDALKRAGIEVEADGLQYHIKGNQKYQPFDCTVEGDDSQMAFFAEEAMIHNVPIKVLNLNHDSRQGDHVILEIVQKLGGCVTETAGGYQFAGGSLHGAEIDLGDCPDLGPALFALAARCQGETVFRNAGRLRIKESDRIACMEEEMRKLGCTISSSENEVTVRGCTKIHGGVTLNGHNDHRIVMALSVLASIADAPVVMTGSEAVSKSYPEFFTDLKKTGVEVHD